MKLVPVKERIDAVEVLYALLSERTPEQSISHKGMPSWDEHCRFVESAPYADWCLIDCEGECSGPKRYGDIVGAIYLTAANEIGVSVFRDYQCLGIGAAAVKLFMAKHGSRRYLANVNPANEASKALWRKLGFNLLQETYARDHRDP